jgi:hypothetical protein
MSKISIPHLCAFGLFATDHFKKPVDEISSGI